MARARKQKRKAKTKIRAIARRGLMLVLSSPSGAGKTTLSRLLLKADPSVELSVSVTTRPKRAGEKHGSCVALSWITIKRGVFQSTCRR